MPESAPWTATRDAYDGIAEHYAAFAAERFLADPLDQAMLPALAALIEAAGGGPVADVGCGPGHLTAHLDSLGARAFGLDLSPAMVALARRTHPGLHFAVAAMDRLPLEDASLSGLLAHYSIIHTPPRGLPAVLAEFHRALAPQALLLLSFQAHDRPGRLAEPFDHKVAPAHRYSPDEVARLLGRIGIDEVARLVVAAGEDPVRGFPQAHLLARRRAHAVA
ncbi:class I SAM-dependent methyltransferase [Nocardiopsis algeriensis]|uniref:SAM-dependent methyltransferase n=1 Tax=Nocardiopsis algeriensis TaxID=1478215 RepID=A0A841IP78_9ACTN|nr:class I SAM-dependent methyltransferase [Nocardiopsis algeriensis]MBB6119990.1 SAM-dependent methyltransferase [Nocardiopsis algeriensis]